MRRCDLFKTEDKDVHRALDKLVAAIAVVGTIGMIVWAVSALSH